MRTWRDGILDLQMRADVKYAALGHLQSEFSVFILHMANIPGKELCASIVGLVVLTGTISVLKRFKLVGRNVRMSTNTTSSLQ